MSSLQMPSALQLATFGQDERRLSGLIALFGWLAFTGHAGTITDFCKRAQERLLEQFEQSPHLLNTVCVFTRPLQETEYVAADLMFNRWVDTAASVQLDGIGSIVGEERLGRLDETYRQAIKFRIFANRYSGSGEEVIALITHTMSNPSLIQLIDLYPAKLWLFVQGRVIPSWVKQLIQDTLGAGIGLLASYSDSDVVFGFSDDPDTSGFAELDYEPSIGGKLVELVA